MELRVCGGEQGENYEARSDCMKANGGGWDWGGKRGATVWLKGSNLHLPHIQEIFAWKCCLQVTDGSTEKITNKCMFWKDFFFFFLNEGKINDRDSSLQHIKRLRGSLGLIVSRRPLRFSTPLMKLCWQPIPPLISPHVSHLLKAIIACDRIINEFREWIHKHTRRCPWPFKSFQHEEFSSIQTPKH